MLDPAIPASRSGGRWIGAFGSAVAVALGDRRDARARWGKAAAAAAARAAARLAASLSAASFSRRSPRRRAIFAVWACCASTAGGWAFTCTYFVIWNGASARHRSDAAICDRCRNRRNSRATPVLSTNEPDSVIFAILPIRYGAQVVKFTAQYGMISKNSASRFVLFKF